MVLVNATALMRMVLIISVTFVTDINVVSLSSFGYSYISEVRSE